MNGYGAFLEYTVLVAKRKIFFPTFYIFCLSPAFPFVVLEFVSYRRAHIWGNIGDVVS